MQHIPNLSHTQVRVMIYDQVRDTEKNVRATRFSVFRNVPLRSSMNLSSFVCASSLLEGSTSVPHLRVVSETIVNENQFCSALHLQRGRFVRNRLTSALFEENNIVSDTRKPITDANGRAVFFPCCGHTVHNTSNSHNSAM